MIPTTPATLPLLMDEGCQALVLALTPALAAVAGSDGTKADLVTLAHSCVVSPFPRPSTAGHVALAGLVSQPTGWGLRCALHSSPAFTEWLLTPATTDEATVVRQHRMALLLAAAAHPRAGEAAGAALAAALGAAVGVAQGGSGAGAPVVATAAA